MPRVFNGKRKAALAWSACSCSAARGYFSLRIDKFSQQIRVFIIKHRDIIYTKLTLFRDSIHGDLH